MKRTQRICGGNIVTPQGILHGGTLTIEDGMIAEVRSGPAGLAQAGDIDASGLWVLPGMIDSHSDAIEHEIFPRPTSCLPVDISFYELERKLAGQGVTTIYHSFSLWGDNRSNEARKNASVREYVRNIRELQREKRMLRHRIHIRYELTNLAGSAFVEDFLNNGEIDQLSFMDHTPGQGQYRQPDVQIKYIMDKQNKTEEEVLRQLEERKSLPKADPDELLRLAALAHSLGIPLASHDDDTLEKLDVVGEWGATISEFPITLEVAVEAKRRGLHVVMGAPNVLLGRSHSNNLSALEAIREGVVDMLCSDYYPPALLQSVFLLHGLGYELPYAVNLVSRNPAVALGIDGVTGSLEAGKAADILLVGIHRDRPMTEKVFVEGNIVCQMAYQQSLAVSSL
ncbi:alpha-D-ribose 1-methylphosphonate 5-triphosphate diphosphatase [Paenibacillus glycinis]|uniref:Alpha-D-ribose 1-methylphosphonate 5-triphosphate diphosphatase n=1 Tax=Paenibacillus glycinis TaxID=2697035 RepID=A0ABW9XMJ5_9BACL|nr:alpha-D-ribose 1-methylphosphonate 5-triphosphate diphosphatase [Paenibacillus glycinis]NBD23666.1 alpha-D-ribose 1-methylphosphonate 5-triphosphate diphosphatase [Paenibacillus glycinis]